MIISFRVCETLYPVQPGKVLVISEDNLSKEPQASQWAIFFPSVPITQEKWLWLLEDSNIGLLQKQEQYVFLIKPVLLSAWDNLTRFSRHIVFTLCSYSTSQLHSCELNPYFQANNKYPPVINFRHLIKFKKDPK